MLLCRYKQHQPTQKETGEKICDGFDLPSPGYYTREENDRTGITGDIQQMIKSQNWSLQWINRKTPRELWKGLAWAQLLTHFITEFKVALKSSP